MKNIPMRMCIACRQMKPKTEMLRIVKNNQDEISLDTTGKKPGRGAYICNDENCIKKLRKVKLLNKTFSTAVADEVYDGIEEEFGRSGKDS